MPPMIATAIGPKKTLRESGIIASTAASTRAYPPLVHSAARGYR
jgi:hypothetical protein